ncbi:uncharacterized protein LOC109950358 [Prunus persica]|uniref:uncharacterized protein LOC109950358 n=1 Tax=Prunus persica TaxID=3760 RepID=UPI0009AB50BE|nr:uncharacterized protein LOC109950358 [Prunus persica]
MIVTGDDLDEIGKRKGYLASEFTMNDLEGLKYFLGIEVTRSEHGIFLSQRKYVLDLLKEIVSVVSRFMHNPSVRHMDVAVRILRYLKFVRGKGLMFLRHEYVKVVGYTDSDWRRKRDKRRSTSGYFTFVGGNLVTWRSKKHKVVSLSSGEAEYRAGERCL